MKLCVLSALFFFTTAVFAQSIGKEEAAHIIREADAYKKQALALPDEDLDNKTSYFQKAAASYKKAGDRLKEAEAFNEISVLYHSADSIALSIQYTQKAVAVKKSIGYKNFFNEYTMLGLNLRVQGKYKEALAYSLAAEKIADTEEVNQTWVGILYNLIGTIYSEMKYHDKSLEYYKKAIEKAREVNDIDGVDSIKINTARGLLERNKAKEALDILNNGSRYYPGKDCNVEYATIYLLTYCKLKQYSKARPYYEELLYCKDGKHKNNIEHEKIYYAIIQYLLQTGQADKAYPHIAQLRKLAKNNNDLYDLAELEITHFQADSATGNYKGAIEHLKAHQHLNDSLFNINNSKQFADLQLKYESEKKDKNIKLLKQQSELQNERINNDTVIRYVFICSLVVLFIILGLLYNRYCIKQRNNRKLEAQQAEINRKNHVLQHLVEEKEWLLKEIHHRVKNNLQIVISLLNTQSAYLDNEDALLAIQNSQHRMQAMSLIHQKLYQTENLSTIDMSWYIYELVHYLKESFDHERKIKFKLDTDRVELDVAQAVPLGLILNEAINNAIKYAFVGREKGKVSVSLKNAGDGSYRLIIADNGVGVPEGFEDRERESLGMNLMMGLTCQLDGEFELEHNNGLSIIITFTPKQQLPDNAA